MKEELQGKLVEILTSIQTVAGKAGDFALEQLPDIAQSYVAFGRAWESLMVALMVAVLVCIYRGTAKVYQQCKANPRAYDEMPAPLAWFFGALASIIPAVILLVHMKPALMVWFAPKVWLLKEIATLLK